MLAKRVAVAIAAFAVALALIGCGSRGRREQAQWLANWVAKQSYSTWSTFRSSTRSPHQPDSPDGLTLGSPQVFAAIGCNDKDLSSLDVLWADENTLRLLVKPMTVSVRVGGSGPRALGSFSQQTLRRVRHTSIAVSQSEETGLRVTSVDFAPMAKENGFLVRWFLVENTGKRKANVSLTFGVNAPGAWLRRDARAWQVGEKLAVVSDVELSHEGEGLVADLGRLAPGGKSAAALLIVGGRDSKRLSGYVAAAEKALKRLPKLLEETKANWEEWCARTPLRTGDERADDLLDSLLCLVRSHLGTRAIHTGSLQYAHNRAWVRDDYWVQRALLELGLTEEAKRSLNFFHAAWKQSGVCSSYEIADLSGQAYGYMGVELPHYLVLMVRDAEAIGRVDGAQYWDMVRGCLDSAAVPGDGLQPMNGDETWLLASPVRELDSLLDNSFLLIASAEYGARLAQKMGDRERAVRYGQMAYRARLGLRAFMPAPYQPHWYATGRGGDGSLDFSLCPEVYARGVLLGVLAEDEFIVEGLVTSWEQLNFDRGIRTHARSATISGGTPGYVLYAAADIPVCDGAFNRELARRVLSFASATGCVWEYHDLYDPAWGGEKRRLWDSAVLLMGLRHALSDVQYRAGAVSLVPKGPPPSVEYERPPGARPMDRETARKLADASDRPLILQDGSPEHAARIARELTRQRNRQFEIGAFTGTAPDDQPAIIISPSPPPSDWAQQHLSYWRREWDGPPQVWVMNVGDVYHDTEPLLRDLLCALPPVREKPMRYPDANLDLAARFGEEAEGEAELTAQCGEAFGMDAVALDGGNASLRLAGREVSVATESEREQRLVKLTVSAGPQQGLTELTVTLPPGWWLVRARDMSGQWDRVEDPAQQLNLPDGRTRLVCSFRQNTEPVNITFELARLGVVKR